MKKEEDATKLKLNLNFQFKDLDDKVLPGEINHAGKTLAQALWNANSGKSLKMSTWAVDLFKGKCIDMESHEVEILRAWIEAYGVNPKPSDLIVPTLTDGRKVQILERLG